ncbi:hypothetical protein [Soonwooa sp.]|uniref:hypothetical protein n=1 Tax=Soonwooa sp. TaxID=1938592 RepID=UPI002606FC91|nr:hypothetical protein [Soonwooa sp.]
MKFSKTSIFIILISVLGIIYLPLKLIILKNNLIPITGNIVDVSRTYTKSVTYQFRIANYPNLFHSNTGGILSDFKNDKAILFKSLHKDITFFINKNDHKKLLEGKDIVYLGVDKDYLFVDLFNYYYSGFGAAFYAFLCLFMVTLNVFGIYTYKHKIFTILALIYLASFYLLLAL